MGDAYGEGEVLYCTEVAKNGFRYDKNTNVFIPSEFFVDRLKMKLGKDSNIILVQSDGRKRKMSCKYLEFDEKTICNLR